MGMRVRRPGFWMWLAAVVVVGGPVLLVAGILLAMNTGAGRREAEVLVARVSGGGVRIVGLAGRFPDEVRVDRVELADARGVWLSARGIVLDWSAWRLLGREARVRTLTIAAVDVTRAPVGVSAKPVSRSGVGLPVSVDAKLVEVGDISLGQELLGAGFHLSGTGSVHVRRFAAGARPVGGVELAVRRIGAAGEASVHAVLTRDRLESRVNAREPAGGLMARAAGLDAVGAVGLAASLAGPWRAAELHFSLAAGALRAGANGTVDLDAGGARLAVTADAPAMAPAPGVAWQSVAIAGRLAGPFARPEAAGTVEIAALAAAGARIGHIGARFAADTRTGTLTAEARDIGLPAPNQALLAGGALNLAATIRLDDPRRPVSLRFDCAQLSGVGSAVLGPEFSGKLAVSVPDLNALSRPSGRAVDGHAGFTLAVARHAGASRIDLDAAMAVTGGADAPAAARGNTTLGATVTLDGGDIVLSRLALDGTTVHAAATGSRRGGQVVAAWELHSSDLHELEKTLRGRVDATGHLAGTQQDFSADADVSGVVGAGSMAAAPLHLVARGSGLPGNASGHLTGTAGVAGADLHLDVNAVRDGKNALRVTIGRAEWKSAAVAGELTLKPPALPVGRLTLRMARLDDLRPLLGRALTGSLSGQLELAAVGSGSLHVSAMGAGVAGAASVERAVLDARIADPGGRPVIAGTLVGRGVRAGGVNADVSVVANGPLDALRLRLTGGVHQLGGADATVEAAGTLDTTAHALTLSSLRTAWHDETLVLTAPAQLSYTPGVAVDRLRLAAATVGAPPATLEVAGTISPALALRITGRGITPGLARPVAPGLAADGTMAVDAQLSGTAAAPSGTMRVAVDGLHARGGTARALPPAKLRALLTLAGGAGQLDATLDAGGGAHLAVRGAVPLRAGGGISVRATGTLGLALLDPILTASGRRVRGNLGLDAAVTGTVAAPNATGTLRWTGGEVQDYAQGVHITDIAATLVASGDGVRVEHFSGRAGGGTIAVAGSVGLRGKLPVDISITADNARPVTSDLVTATLDAALSLRGNAAERVAASGRIHVRRADIQVPDKLPGSVAVLDVRRAGERAPARDAGAGLQIPLDITLDAPQQVFVRGHGLDAELGGSLHIGGTAANPQTSGAIELRRGEYSLAGQTLNFTSGDISFNGAGRINPALDLIATSSNADITATLAVGGYASAPTIKLSSVPDRPQDEVLAALLFHQSASSLGPFQLAQIGVALAQVSGIGGGGIDPISRLRNGLGLDRLSVGSSGTGSTVTTAVEAGRYVRPGVYVGAKQGTSGAQTQAEVQIDLYKGLKLQTEAGSGPGGNTVGLTYQFQY